MPINKLPHDAAVGDFSILHNGNHNNNGDPHTQYVRNSGVFTAKATDSTHWAILTTVVTPKNAFDSAEFLLAIADGHSDNNNNGGSYSTLFFKVRGQNTANPVITLKLSNVEGKLLTKDLFQACLIDSGTNWTIEIRLNLPSNQYIVYRLLEQSVITSTKGTTINFNSVNAWQSYTSAQLSAGTVFNCEYSDGNFRSVKSEKYDGFRTTFAPDNTSWAKIATVTLNTVYEDVYSVIRAWGGVQSNKTAWYTTLLFEVRKDVDGSSNPLAHVKLHQMDSYGTSPNFTISNVMAVVQQINATTCIVELYVKSPSTNDYINYIFQSAHTGITDIDNLRVWNNQNFSTLPSGVSQVACTRLTAN